MAERPSVGCVQASYADELPEPQAVPVEVRSPELINAAQPAVVVEIVSEPAYRLVELAVRNDE